MILISKTYSTITPESCENGDYDDTGFIFENEPCTFREVLDYLKNHREPSCYPLRKTDNMENVWFSSGFEIEDYSTLEEKETSIHFSSDNKPRALKWWKKAIIYSNLIIG